MMLVERAAEKPSMLKLISVAVHRARPAMTGNRDRFTHSPAHWETNSTYSTNPYPEYPVPVLLV